jgi:cobalt/nickel transport system permease protein
MHIPDGFLDPITVVITYIILIFYILFNVRYMKNSKITEEAPLITIIAASIFVAQMINWPLPGGTSLHLVGGAIAGIILGPQLGFLTMFIVVAIQALVFHDGGITTLAANTINMAIIDVLAGYYIYKLITSLSNSKRAGVVGAFIGGWMGITLAGLACGLEIGYSFYFGFNISITVPIMVTWHFLLGIIEGIITALTFDYLSRRPDFLYLSRSGVKLIDGKIE